MSMSNTKVVPIPVNWVRTPDGAVEWCEENDDLLEKITEPGNRLIRKDGGVLLVGDVNTELGRCNCCRESRDDIVAYIPAQAHSDHKGSHQAMDREIKIAKARQKIVNAIKHLGAGVWIPDIISLLEDALNLLNSAKRDKKERLKPQCPPMNTTK